MNPLELTKTIADLTAENSKGSEALYAAEIELAHAENNLDLIEQKAFIRSEGTVADRTALARLEASQARLERDIAKASANRIRIKIRSLETAIMASATQAKLLAAEMKL